MRYCVAIHRYSNIFLYVPSTCTCIIVFRVFSASLFNQRSDVKVILHHYVHKIVKMSKQSFYELLM